MSECEHKFTYQGVVHWSAQHQLPGSGAYARIYGDKYFCEKCLDVRITNERTVGNTYSQPIAGTMPR